MKKISVIMSVYNESTNWVKQSINSILNQTYQNIEFIIVLDKPDNKKLKELLFKYKENDSRIILVINDENIGLVKSLNKAISVSSGEYIARMDADDISFQNRLKRQIQYLEKNKNIHLVSSTAIYIDENNNIINKSSTYADNCKKAKKCLKYRNVFFHPSWMFRKNILNKIKQYNDIPTAEDYDFLCRVILNDFNIIKLSEELIYYRIRKNSITNNKGLYQQNVTKILKKYYKKSLKNKSKYDNEKIKSEINKIKINNLDNEKYWNSITLYNLGISQIKGKKTFKGIINILKCLKINKMKILDIRDIVYLKIIDRKYI